ITRFRPSSVSRTLSPNPRKFQFRVAKKWGAGHKVKLPPYLFSPRKGAKTRQNALQHLDQHHYLTIDLKQFYPSTSFLMVRRWLIADLGMYEDVADLLTHLVTIDNVVSFGSPVTPVLVALVHRRLFDNIAALCATYQLNYTVWVDDLTISGPSIPGDLVVQIRELIAQAGLQSHKVRFQTGNRAVFITGVGVVGARLVVPNKYNLKLKGLWEAYYQAITPEEKLSCVDPLLSIMGTIRYITGRRSRIGQKMSNQMNSLRQERDKIYNRIIIDAKSEDIQQFEECIFAEAIPWD
ncbi:reverse transcriptase family protein, partial [Asticcacaulis taihuensis]